MKRFNWYKRTILSVACIGMVFSVMAQNSDVLMTIGKENVSKKEFEYVFKKNNKQALNPDEKSLREYLDLYINFKLKVIEAKSLGMDTVGSFIKELAGYRKQLAAPYLTDKEVNERLINEAWERSQKEIRASHILVNCTEDASPKDTLAAFNKIMALRKRIVERKEDFGKVASEGSQDPTAKNNKGDLGYFSAFAMVYPFESVCYTTKLGSVSMPFRTRYGYHIVKVVDTRPAQGEVKAAHIMIRFNEKATKQDTLKGKEKIDEIYARLVKGEKFDELAKQYSEDKASAKNGGAMQMFGTGKMVLEFEQQAFALKNIGDYSKPFTTPYGWHIVKLLERKAPPAFEKAKEDLKAKINRDTRSDLNKISFISKLKKNYSFTENNKALQYFYADLDSSLLKATFKKSQTKNPTELLFTIQGEKYLVSDFADYIVTAQLGITKESAFKVKKDLYDMYVSKMLMDYEEARLDAKYPEFKALMEEYRDGILLFELTDQKVWSAAVKDTAGLESFFKGNQIKYMWPDRLNATIYTCANAEIAKEVRALLKNKKITQDSLLRRVNKQNPLNLTIKTDKFEPGENSIIDGIAWKKGLSKDITSNNTVVFVSVKEKMKAQPKQFSEVRGAATADYQTYLEKNWLDNLRKKYPVAVNDPVFKSLISK
jgi:peptidyl-prolyl cis-trans isomerase SurA